MLDPARIGRAEEVSVEVVVRSEPETEGGGREDLLIDWLGSPEVWRKPKMVKMKKTFILYGFQILCLVCKFTVDV